MGRHKKSETMKVEKKDKTETSTKNVNAPDVKLSGSKLKVNIRFDKVDYMAGDNAPDGLLKWIAETGLNKTDFVG